MTLYLIARDATGKIVAKRSTTRTGYQFATSKGTFHARRDLVPVGAVAYPVEEISAAEFRALSMKKTDSVEALTRKVESARASLQQSEESLARNVERLHAVEAGEIPTETRTYDAYTPPRTVVGFVFPGEDWICTLDTLQRNVASSRHWLERSRKTLTNYEKRLAAAQRKAAKAS